MHVIKARNVNHAWARAVPLLHQIGERSSSRAGDVLVAPCPVMTVYDSPCERVLFDPARDANPIFHLMECLWMMAGRADAAFLDQFVGDFGRRFAELDGNIHGAYGRRWRGHFCTPGDEGIDQLEAVVQTLSTDPDSRQAVVAMWDPHADLRYEDGDDIMNGSWRDRPCNTHVYLRVRNDVEVRGGTMGDPTPYQEQTAYLDMTVCCRSNDIVWGAYGANAVHFSFLQEYLAGRLGVDVGRLYQLSNNWHAYVPVLDKYTEKLPGFLTGVAPFDPYSGGTVQPMPIGDKWGSWDDDLGKFMSGTETSHDDYHFQNSWFEIVAKQMWRVHRLWKIGDRDAALRACDDVAASDWARAAREWMLRRMK